MNPTTMIAVSLLIGMVPATSPAEARIQAMEAVDVPLTTVLAPETGFDDNDNVQVVAYGRLPNTCYHLGQASAEATGDPHVFRVQQSAMRDRSGICQSDDGLSPAQRNPVPFTSEISLGQLSAGTYQFDYTQPGSYGSLAQASLSLTVGKALEPTIDDVPYAATSTLMVPDIINGSDHIVVQVSGVLLNSCMHLNPTIQILKEKDVYVIMPTVTVPTSGLCSQIVTTFSRTVDLGKADQPGYYLIQVRSMNGRAVNHVIEVMK